MFGMINQQSVFQNELTNGEKLLWTGQPDPSVNFNRGDIFLVPFSFLWAGIACSDFIPGLSHAKNAPMQFQIAFIPFIAAAFYVTIGRFIFKKIKKRSTFYAITNKRVLTITKLFGKNIQSEYINTLPAINKNIRNSGVGTISFGNNSMRWMDYSNSGMGFRGTTPLCFYDIKDANRVYQIVSDLRNTQTKPTEESS